MKAKNVWTKALAAFIFAAFAIACGANEGIMRSGKPDPNAANALPMLSSVERDLGDMRTAGFTTILVIRRKDGGKLETEDRGVIRVQTTDANRRIASDEDKAIVIGSNHPLGPDKIEVLSARFAVEDLSPPPAPDQANTSNVNK